MYLLGSMEICFGVGTAGGEAGERVKMRRNAGVRNMRASRLGRIQAARVGYQRRHVSALTVQYVSGSCIEH